MANYIPTSIKTGKDLPVITQEEKDWYESEDSPVKGKFRFRELKEPKQIAPAPTEAKAVQAKEENKPSQA